MKKYLQLGFAILFFGLGSSAYSASATVYGTESDYLAAVDSQLFLIDFNGSSGAYVDGSTISSHATFGSPEASNPNLVLWNSNALSDAGSTTEPNNVGPLSIEFTDPSSVFAFSLDFLSSGAQETVELYDSSNVLFESVLAPNASGFFGVISSVAIDHVIIRNGLFYNSTYPNGANDRFFIDNLTADSVSAVPVPAAVWLFGSGLMGLVGFSKRRNA